MPRQWHPTLERIVHWLKPPAESLAAAAALYGPDLMLQLEATPGGVEGPRSPECDGRSREIGPRRRRGAVLASPFCHEAHFGDPTPALGQRRPAASDRIGWQDGSDGDLEGARRCPAR